jgi:hypothetical protein
MRSELYQTHSEFAHLYSGLTLPSLEMVHRSDFHYGRTMPPVPRKLGHPVH